MNSVVSHNQHPQRSRIEYATELSELIRTALRGPEADLIELNQPSGPYAGRSPYIANLVCMAQGEFSSGVGYATGDGRTNFYQYQMAVLAKRHV